MVDVCRASVDCIHFIYRHEPRGSCDGQSVVNAQALARRGVVAKVSHIAVSKCDLIHSLMKFFSRPIECGSSCCGATIEEWTCPAKASSFSTIWSGTSMCSTSSARSAARRGRYHFHRTSAVRVDRRDYDRLLARAGAVMLSRLGASARGKAGSLEGPVRVLAV